MDRDKSNNKGNRYNIVWGDYEEMIKHDPTKKIPPEWVIFSKIQNRDEKRRRVYFFINILWWILFGSGIIISLASTLVILHENIFPIEKPDTLWESVITVIIFLYFIIAIGSVAWLLEIKKENNEKYREEVYSFFQRYYDEADSRYKDWKISQIKTVLSITKRLREETGFNDFEIKEDICAIEEVYEELLKELEN